jgi:FKBP-type peptidyl-prolyl cis-trans isomerase FklB
MTSTSSKVICQGEDTIMTKFANVLVTLNLAAVVLVSSAVAQTSAGTPQSAPAKPKAAPAAVKTSSAHTGTGTVAQKNGSTPVYASQKDRMSYAVGMNIADTLRNKKYDLNPEAVAQGLKDSLSGDKTQMTEPEADSMVTILQDEMKARKEAEQEQAEQRATADQRTQAADANKKEGETFLAANKTKEGVVTLPSGLQYRILKQGDGPKPTTADNVVCNYRGTMINGTEFDSSYKRGQPITFPVSGVIKGWTEALQLMPTGSKWQLFIPPDLAYGPRGAGGLIGPNATLIFEVDLISIQNKEAPQDKK